ncbi:MAG: hypothetical protein JST67_05590 [Bacteroidetes bacterium]|nr:hypothetical protein [Bacteroidota bacterium]
MRKQALIYMPKYGLLWLLLVAFSSFAQTDSIKKIKTPKHYFTPTIFTDYYANPSINLDDGLRKSTNNPTVRNKLKNYQYNQFVGGFYFPIATKDFHHADGSISNLHLLGTGNYMMGMPNFSGITNHTLLKASVGLRSIYNTGKKLIWFLDITPFMSTDLSANCYTSYRWAGAFLVDYMVSPYFSFRVGVMRSFMYGNRYHLPYVGLRFGRLDKTYLSIQFPRNITISVPAGKYLRLSAYIKPMGGVFNMANNDGLYTKNNDKTILYGRYELITGLRVDATFNQHISIFASAGFTGIRSVSLYSTSENQDNQFVLNNFYNQQVPRGAFINAGFTIRIGRAKSIYNNYSIYETFNLNTTIDTGDNNTNTGDGNIPNQTKTSKPVNNLKIKDVQDLIEAQDMY